MPSKPSRLCPRCKRVVKGACEQCNKQREVLKDQRRGSSHERGYDGRWREYSKARLAQHPLCVDCEKRGKLTAATLTGHMVPGWADKSRFWDETNHVSQCASCNAKQDHRDRVKYSSGGITRVVVCGPPASGKTTYVRERRQAGDYVWDWDDVRLCVFGKDAGQTATDMERKLLTSMLNGAAHMLSGDTTQRAWFIATDRGHAQAIADIIGGVVVAMETPLDVCLARVRERGLSSDRERELSEAVRRWCVST